MDRLLIVARLRKGSHAAAEALLAAGPPFDPEELPLDGHGAYLTATEVVFVFEARDVEWIVNDLVDDPVLAAALTPWHQVIEGPPRIAHERFYWSRGQNNLGVGLGT
jgi:hypothetical protein